MKELPPDRARRLGAIVLMAGFLLSCGSSSQNLLREAEANWRKGRLTEALQGNQALYQSEPKGRFAARALLNIANIQYLNLRQLKPAIQFYEKVVREFPVSPEAAEAHRHLADIYANELNDKDQAIAHYDALLDLENLPDRPSILFQRADLYFKREEYDRALREMHALEEMAIDDHLADQVQLKIGSIYQIEKDFDKALEPFAKAVSSKYPESRRRAILGLAETYELLLDFDKAIATLRKLDSTAENNAFVAAETDRLKKRRSAVEHGTGLNFLRGKK